LANAAKKDCTAVVEDADELTCGSQASPSHPSFHVEFVLRSVAVGIFANHFGPDESLNALVGTAFVGVVE